MCSKGGGGGGGDGGDDGDVCLLLWREIGNRANL
jgi:hypothetical protein